MTRNLPLMCMHFQMVITLYQKIKNKNTKQVQQRIKKGNPVH